MKCEDCSVSMIKLPPITIDGIYEEIFECPFCGTVKTRRKQAISKGRLIEEDDYD